MNPLVSMIVPVYNGEQDIINFADTIAKQTYRPLEIVFVNDGSADLTKARLTSYAAVRLRADGIDVFIATHATNRGTFEAEMTGVMVASGEYVFFQDIDDFPAPDMIEKLMAHRLKHRDNVHLPLPTRLVLDGKPVEGDSLSAVWHSETAVEEVLRKQCLQGIGKLARRSLFRRDMMREIYDELRDILAECGIDRINSCQDAIVITYMIATERITEIIEPDDVEYLYTADSASSVSYDHDVRAKDIPVLYALSAWALGLPAELAIELVERNIYIGLERRDAWLERIREIAPPLFDALSRRNPVCAP